MMTNDVILKEIIHVFRINKHKILNMKKPVTKDIYKIAYQEQEVEPSYSFLQGEPCPHDLLAHKKKSNQ